MGFLWEKPIPVFNPGPSLAACPRPNGIGAFHLLPTCRSLELTTECSGWACPGVFQGPTILLYRTTHHQWGAQSGWGLPFSDDCGGLPDGQLGQLFSVLLFCCVGLANTCLSLSLFGPWQHVGSFGHSASRDRIWFPHRI